MMSLVGSSTRAKPLPHMIPAVAYKIQMEGVSRYATASPDSRNPDILTPIPEHDAIQNHVKKVVGASY